MPNGPVFIDLKGYEISKAEEIILQHAMVGGVVLYSKNCKNKAQLKQLISNIRKLRPNILIAVEQEGRHVSPFKGPEFNLFPPADIYERVYNQSKNRNLCDWRYFTQAQAETMAEELASLGININLASGFNCISHANPGIRKDIAIVFTQGLQNKGIKTTGKYFPELVYPSHSLTSPAISNMDQTTLAANHIRPYLPLIQGNKLDAIILAHIVYTKVDETNPADCSKKWIDILREKLKFNGVIMSHCLSKAEADKQSKPGVAEKNLTQKAMLALQEGCCDMAIMCNQSPALILEVLNHLAKNLKQSEASKTRIAKLSQRENQPNEMKQEQDPLIFSAPIKPNNSISITPNEPSAKQKATLG